MSPNDSKPPAILTETQREYLVDGPDDGMSPAAERAMRARIRKRLQAGISDLSAAFKHLEKRDWERVFEELDFTSHPDAMLAVEYVKTPYVIQYALAFFLQRYEMDEGVERGVSEALDRVSEKRMDAREWSVTIESEEHTLGIEELRKLEEQLQAGEISPNKIREYHDQGRIGFDAYFQLTRGLEFFKPISRERYHELLEEPVPMLEEDEDDE